MSGAPLEILEIEYWGDTAARLTPLAAEPWFVFLDSCRCSGASGRFDVAAWSPDTTFLTAGATTTVATVDTSFAAADDPFDLLDACLLAEPTHEWLPFVGGAIGYFGYDLARRLECLPQQTRRDIDLPDMAVGIYNRGLIVDHEQARAWFFHRGLAAAEVTAALNLLAVPRTLTPAAVGTDFVVTSPVAADITFAEYAECFSRIKHYIRDGDCYQVNYAQRFSASAEGNPWDAYRRLRILNSAPYAAFLRLPHGAVLSSSPERFIAVRDGAVETRPIKGTRARVADPVADAAVTAELAACSKDRAENLMIVDLLRNDIGKVCKTGSVRVPRLFELESFARVHHLVSTVTGQLGDGTHPLALLRACFPGGSITGAPKLRAMEIIEELEQTRRSVYCGAIGYASHDGQMDTNIAIRSLVFDGDRLYCWAGGGIVMDSELAAEYQESLDKAAAMLSVFSDAESAHLGR